MKKTLVAPAAALLLPFSGPSLAAPAQVPKIPTISVAPAATPKPSADTDPAVAAAQEHLHFVTAGYQAGINTIEDVDKATIAVAEARLQVAIAHNKPGDISQNLAVIVAQRQELLTLTQAQYRAGLIGADAVSQAQADLAEAQARLAAHTHTSRRA